jgi:serine/threonine protein kinase
MFLHPVECWGAIGLSAFWVAAAWAACSWRTTRHFTATWRSRLSSDLPTAALREAESLREARSAGALNHPNICTIHEVGEANGAAFIAMEYVEGRSLRDRIDEGALPLDEVLHYGIQASDALGYAHDHGVIHRDFKAANVMVQPSGRLKIVDFGLARRDDALMADATTMASLVPTGAVAGPPYAMAPEQVCGQAGAWRAVVRDGEWQETV